MSFKKIILLGVTTVMMNSIVYAGKADDLIGDVKNKVVNIQSRVIEVQTKTRTVFNKVNDLPQAVLDQLNTKFGIAMDNDMVEKLKEPLQDSFQKFKHNIEDRKTKLNSFTSQCESFKALLKDTFLNITNVTKTIRDSSAIAINMPELSFNQLNEDLYKKIPCLTFLPLALATKTTNKEFGGGLSSINEAMNSFGNNFKVAENIIFKQRGAKNNILFSSFENDYNSAQCQFIYNNVHEVKTTHNFFARQEFIMKWISEYISPSNFVGGFNVDALAWEIGDKSVGVHGYADINLKKPKAKSKVADTFKYISQAMGLLKLAIKTPMTDCGTAMQEHTALVRHDELMNEVCALRRYRSAACQPYRP